jgi:hypothetical protein
LIRLAVLLVVCVIAIGLYRGWFAVSSTTNKGTRDEIDVKATINRQKIESDVQKVEKKLGEGVEHRDKQSDGGGAKPGGS